MLLFLLRDFPRPSEPPGGSLPVDPPRDYASALLAAALFLSVWCVLRLFAGGGASIGVDVALAVLFLAVGVRTVVHCLRSEPGGRRRLPAGRRPPR